MSEFPSSFKKWSQKEQEEWAGEVKTNRELRRRRKEDPNYGKHNWLFEKWKKEKRGSRTKRFVDAIKGLFPKTEKQEK